MIHLTELQLSMFSDNALTGAELAVVKNHMKQCSSCRETATSFQHESLLIQNAFIQEYQQSISPVPHFIQPVSFKELSISLMILSLFLWAIISFWQFLYQTFIPEMASWFTNLHITDSITPTIQSVFYLVKEGSSMLSTVITFAFFSMFMACMAWFIMSRKNYRAGLSTSLAMLATVSMVSPHPAEAMELRRSQQMLTISADEIIDDTLVAFADSIIVDGDIEGDLVTFARRVIINGEVKGNLVTFTQNLSVNGSINGSIITFASEVDLTNALISGDLWSFTNTLKIDQNSTIEGNATTFNNTSIVNGNINRDLTSFAQSIELNGRIGEDVEAYGQTLNLFDNTRVGGDIRFRTKDASGLIQSDNAIIGGEVEILEGMEPPQARNRYHNPGFYFSQLLRFASALIMGLILFQLFPALKTLKINSGIAGLKTVGIGLVALPAIPIILLFSAITVIGLPVTFIGLLLYLIAIYFAKILFATVLGKLLLKKDDSSTSIFKALALGLALVIILTNLPAIGGILSFIILITGLGLIVQLVYKHFNSDNRPATAAI